MFATYEEFKDALKNFHPKKIGYTYCTLNQGWIDDKNTPTYKVTKDDGTWMLWLVKEKTESHVESVTQNEPLQTRNLLHRLEIIALEDYWQELYEDQDLDYP